MLFNSDVFLAFLAAFGLAHYLVRHRLPLRNVLIVAASFVFYGWWDWRFLGLMVGTSLVDFAVGLGLQRTTSPRGRRAWLWLSIATNLSVLGYFKYHDFFVDSFAALLASFGLSTSLAPLNLILPVGISFYTFQALSYVIDVYRRELPATANVIQFLAYISFFPQLVAGPIERASHLLPQFAEPRALTAAQLETGLWLLLWGMFKKVVLADNFGPVADLAYAHPDPTAPLVMLGTLAFGLQIYCDFSGYSDIARGVAQWLGFDIMVNFNLPYTATNLRDFWQRWHISLSTWLRDYLYVSLGGNRHGRARTLRNLTLTLGLGGLWHGAAANFLLWGLWHAAGLCLHRLWTWHPRLAGRCPALLGWALTMGFVFYGWFLFRVRSLESAYLMTRALTDWTVPFWLDLPAWNLLLLTAPLGLVHWAQHRTGDLLVTLRLSPWARGVLQATLLFAIIAFWRKDDPNPFIYFQF